MIKDQKNAKNTKIKKINVEYYNLKHLLKW